MQYKILTVDHYDELEANNKRITISAANACGMAADVNDITVQGRQLRHVVVLMTDGGSLDLVVNHGDLALLEEAIGAFPDLGAM